jgi:hypothetical protein
VVWSVEISTEATQRGTEPPKWDYCFFFVFVEVFGGVLLLTVPVEVFGGVLLLTVPVEVFDGVLTLTVYIEPVGGGTGLILSLGFAGLNPILFPSV